MDIQTQSTDTYVILSPAGKIDQVSAKAFEEAVMAHVPACTEGGQALIINMKDVSFISSVGLRAFMIASKSTRPQKGRLIAADMNDVVREVFQISRFDKVIEVFDTTDAAIAAL